MADEVVESCLKKWRDKLAQRNKNKDLTPAEICSLFRQKDLLEAFFRIVDRDNNECLNYEEWIGTFTKSIDPKDISLVDWFVDQFDKYTEINGENILSKSDFNEILSDNEFGYRFSLLISSKGKKIKAIELLSTLEIMASLSTDGKWLSWLRYQFTNALHKVNKNKPQSEISQTMNSMEANISLHDFMQSFEFKEPFLAQRIFNYLDYNNTGYLSMREFINGLEIIVNGNQTDKMKFLFNVFDLNGDGLIDLEEMKMLLKCCMEDTPYVDTDQTMEELASYLFTNSDKDNSGDINFEELQNALKKYDSIFSQLTFSTSIWIKPKFIGTQHKKGTKGKIQYKLKSIWNNKQPQIIFWSIYLAIHFACSFNAYISYSHMSIWMIIARVFGAALNFNCALMLVLVLRKHFTWMRTKGGHAILPIDDFIEIHKFIGCVILVESLIHTGAHLINLYLMCMENYLNFFEVLLTGVVNIGYPTGVLLLAMFGVIFLFAMPFVRRSGYFQIFHWFHMLSIPWLLIMIFHGKKFWMWILIPLFCYTLENVLRYRKISSHKFGETFIEESYVLPSKTVHLVIKKPPKFRFSPGDYIFINIPTIAKYEWHPFSISSAPERSDYIWLHIRAVGNWTNKLLAFSMSSKFDMSMMSHNRSLNPGHNMRTTCMNLQQLAVKEDTHDNQQLSSEGQDNCLKISTDEKKIVSFENDMKSVELRKLETTSCVQKSILKKTVDCKNDYSVDTLDSVYTTVIIENTFNNTKNKHDSSIIATHDEEKTNEPSETIKSPDRVIGNTNVANGSDEIDPHGESTPKKGEEKRDSMGDESDIDACRANTSLNQLRTSVDEMCDESYSFSKDNIRSMATYSQNLLKDEHKNELSVIINSDKGERKTIDTSDETSLDESSSKMSQLTCIQTQCNKSSNLINKLNNVMVTSMEKVNIKSAKDDQSESLINKDKTGKTVENGKRYFDYFNASDTLGYHQMYNKEARVNMGTIGLDNLWRLRIFIDGPYGTPSSSIFDAEHAVLVGAGIGITPFASILQSMMQRYRQSQAKCPNCKNDLGKYLCSGEKLQVKKVDFIWVTREQRSLEWFISMLSRMEIEQRKINLETEKSNNSCQRNMFMESHLYVTSAKRQSDLKSISLHLSLDALYSKEDNSLIDGLRKRTRYGRPNWDIVMQNLVRQQKGKISLFYCGPPALATLLSKKCTEYDFSFSREIF